MTVTKRISILLLALVLLLCALPGAAAAGRGFADQSSIRNTEAVQMLTELGVISGFPDGTFRPEQTVTREQAAKMIASILQRKDNSFSWDGTLSFADPSTWANEFIEYCAGKGIIAGYSDGTFDPMGCITAQQMFKMLLVAIGNDPVPYVGDNWLENVRADAEENNLYDNFGGDESASLTRDDACLLLFNALKCRAISGFDENGQPQYYLDDLMNPKTVLEYYFDVKMYTEIVTGNEFADLTAENARLSEGKTKIAGHKEFEVSTGMEYLGRQVNIYLNSSGNIVGVPVFSEENLVMTFTGGKEFDKYYGLDQIKLDDDTEYYLNFNKTTFAVIGKLTEDCTITVIDRDGDGSIDVMMVTQFQPVTVSGKSDEGWLLEQTDVLGGVLDFDILYDSGVKLRTGDEIMVALIGGMIHIMK